MNANDTATCYLRGIYKLPKSESKVTCFSLEHPLCACVTCGCTHQIPVTIPWVPFWFRPGSVRVKILLLF